MSTSDELTPKPPPSPSQRVSENADTPVAPRESAPSDHPPIPNVARSNDSIPPIAPPVAGGESSERGAGSRHLRFANAASVAIHLLIVGGLATWMLTSNGSPSGRRPVVIVSNLETGDESVLVALDAPTFETPTVSSGGAPLEALLPVETMDLSTPATVSPMVTTAPINAAEGFDIPWSDLGSGDAPFQEVVPPVPTKGRLGEAATVEVAVDHLTAAIDTESKDGQLRVAWLFDASISMLGDRQRIAARLIEVLGKTGVRNPGEQAQLMMSATAFGATTRPLVKPTSRIGRVIEAVKDPRVVDHSGVENVLAALVQVVEEYRWTRGKLMVVVWTDEAGDDITPVTLESAIAFCRSHGVKVHVVGPSTVFNRRKGTQLWVHPRGFRFRLPVDRGPETATSQRLFAPYWYTMGIPRPDLQRNVLKNADGEMLAMQQEEMALWTAGNQMENLGSGFGPYGLTRLALATGGTYTVFDRPGDRGQIRMAAMERYTPDYRAMAEIMAELPYYPIRRSVLQAVHLSQALRNAMTPPMGDGFSYREPEIFQIRLAKDCRVRAQKALDVAHMYQAALAPFGPDGMEVHYQREPSPRWRAWYDLTRGRMLAQQVRWLEYAAICGRFATRTAPLSPTSNAIALHPRAHLLAPQATLPLAKEATRLLTRCVEENPGTPWKSLAERELMHPLGIDFRQTFIPPPPPPPPIPMGSDMGSGGGGFSISIPRLHVSGKDSRRSLRDRSGTRC